MAWITPTITQQPGSQSYAIGVAANPSFPKMYIIAPAFEMTLFDVVSVAPQRSPTGLAPPIRVSKHEVIDDPTGPIHLVDITVGGSLPVSVDFKIQSGVIGILGNTQINITEGVGLLISVPVKSTLFTQGLLGEGSYIGVEGMSIDGHGVHGFGRNNVGVFGETIGGIAVEGVSTHGNGVYGLSTNSNGVYGSSSSTYGGFFSSASGQADYFNGNVNVTGTINKGALAFQIDHPLDPANKYLSHSAVESPDMKNIYDGAVVLDAKGEASVELPAWFEILNRDFHYQLTAIGASAPNLYIAQKISKNRFNIAGGPPGLEVSWQVTGIRHDPYAEQHRIPVEKQKSAEEHGKYLHPKEYGQPDTMGINYAALQKLQQSEAEAQQRHAELQKREEEMQQRF